MSYIEIPSYKDFDLYIEERSIPNEWTLSLISRYDKAYISPNKREVVHGFYLIKTERASIIFQDENYNEVCSLNAYIDKVWHDAVSPSLKLQTIINPIILQDIDEKIKGHNLFLRWNVSGYGFINERQKHYYDYLIKIEATNEVPMILYRSKFVKDILE